MPLLSRYHPGRYTEEQYNIEKRIVRHSLFIPVLIVVLMWLVKLFEYEFKFDFSPWGILPHAVTGLRGIFFAPFIHADFEHLSANSIPLFVLMFSLFFFYRKFAYTILVMIYLLSGMFVWLGGREALHIGASGIIYGLAAFLFLSGIISYNIRLLTISMVVSLLYGGMFWGIFPMKPGISWESHLWGGISGFALAWFFRKSAPVYPTEVEDGEDDHDLNYQDTESHSELGENEKMG